MHTIAEKIIESIMNDTAVQAELTEASNQDASIAIIIRAATDLGKAITADDVRAYLAQSETDELSDDELDAVVGGSSGRNSILDSNTQLEGSCC